MTGQQLPFDSPPTRAFFAHERLSQANPWVGLDQPITIPDWHGERRMHWLDDSPATVAGVVRRSAAPRRWVPWSLLKPGSRLLTPSEVAGRWPLRHAGET